MSTHLMDAAESGLGHGLNDAVDTAQYITPGSALRACVLIYTQARPGQWVSLRSMVAAMGMPEARIRHVCRQLVETCDLCPQSFNGLDGWTATATPKDGAPTQVVVSAAALAAMSPQPITSA